MKEFVYHENFDVGEVADKICSVMSRWSVHFIDINGPNWIVYDHEMEIKCVFQFRVDFYNLETRIKLEDLKLDVIHFIESLKDDTTYRDNLTNSVFFD